MIIGIDLGTTNSAVAVWRNGAAELIPNSLGHILTPSVVSLDEGGELLVGLAARERIATHPSRTASAFKRLMGSARETQLGDQHFLPEELSALVLGALKADAEAVLGEPVAEAVITVPAYFNDRQRKATRRAGELAGLKVERLLNEPTAAALAYGIHGLGDEARFLVFDLGGGTFDVSILEIFEGIIEVRSSTGDNRLGGEDFNAIIVEMARAHFAADWGDDDRSSGILDARLQVAAETARRALTERPAGVTFQVVWRDRMFEMPITPDAFEVAASQLLARLREPVLRALRDGRINAEMLNEIVLVGGATRMPVVRKAVTRMFGRFPATNVNPDEAVVIGAAIQSGLKARDAALKEVVLTDVCPYSLGVDSSARTGSGIISGLFSPIIERNTVVPASRVSVFSTLSDNQTKVVFNVYQGEARMAADNIQLGRIEVAVPPAPAGQVPIECRFTYDVNGLLEIDVHVPKTGERRGLTILSEGDIAPAELAERRAALAALKHHPRDHDSNRAALARLARSFEESLGERRRYVGELAQQFDAVLQRQDPREIEEARRRLSQALDALDAQTWL
jgi:molecular chaperone HscC